MATTEDKPHFWTELQESAFRDGRWIGESRRIMGAPGKCVWRGMFGEARMLVDRLDHVYLQRQWHYRSHVEALFSCRSSLPTVINLIWLEPKSPGTIFSYPFFPFQKSLSMFILFISQFRGLSDSPSSTWQILRA